MMKQLKLAAVALATLTSLGAQATLFDSSFSLGSFAFFAIDSTGIPTSMVADLAFTLDGADVAVNGFSSNNLLTLAATGHKVQWNFVANTMKIDGVVQPGSFAYSAPYALFQANAQVAETRWAVVAGTTESFPNFYLSTGAPTARQLANQDINSNTGLSFIQQTLARSNQTVDKPGVFAGTQTDGTFGASSVVGLTVTSSGYLGAGGNFGSQGDWRGFLSWSAYTKEGADFSSVLWAMDDNTPGAIQQNIKFSYSAGGLSAEAVTAVPEPTTYALMGAGLLAIALLRRRRQS